MSWKHEPIRGGARNVLLVVAILALIPSAARAQFPGYGWGYGYPGYGYGGYPYGYGMIGYGDPFMGYGYGLGYPFVNYGMPFGYGSPITMSPYWNPLFGVGMTPLGAQGYLYEANLLGRAQLQADRRARFREVYSQLGR